MLSSRYPGTQWGPLVILLCLLPQIPFSSSHSTFLHNHPAKNPEHLHSCTLKATTGSRCVSLPPFLLFVLQISMLRIDWIWMTTSVDMTAHRHSCNHLQLFGVAQHAHIHLTRQDTIALLINQLTCWNVVLCKNLTAHPIPWLFLLWWQHLLPLPPLSPSPSYQCCWTQISLFFLDQCILSV